MFKIIILRRSIFNSQASINLFTKTNYKKIWVKLEHRNKDFDLELINKIYIKYFFIKSYTSYSNYIWTCRLHYFNIFKYYINITSNSFYLLIKN